MRYFKEILLQKSHAATGLKNKAAVKELFEVEMILG